MKDDQKFSVLPRVLYRVKSPLHGTTEEKHRGALFPRDTLLECLPHECGTQSVVVRCYGRDYSVLEEDLLQNCQPVGSSPRLGSTESIFG